MSHKTYSLRAKNKKVLHLCSIRRKTKSFLSQNFSLLCVVHFFILSIDNVPSNDICCATWVKKEATILK